MAIARQRITVFKNNKSQSEIVDDETKGLLIAVEKTGYYNFSVDGKQYYCDERIDTSKITNHVLFVAFSGGSKKKKKGKIIITKK